MQASRSERRKIEQYSRALLDAAKSEGRANADLVQLRHAVKFSPEVLEVLASLQAEDDPQLVSKVYEQIQSLVAADDSTVMVTVTTAVEMDDGLREKVLMKARELFDAAIYLVERVDPGILGGIILEARGQRYDASVHAHLANIHKSLASASILEA
ncbi:MAG TPA: F0F1 ATP synthase subunit delta [Atopobiaceae bacterium]|nr:F0F1 ATP synthase subunit delta [Atopobiaceae bacterium]